MWRAPPKLTFLLLLFAELLVFSLTMGSRLTRLNFSKSSPMLCLGPPAICKGLCLGKTDDWLCLLFTVMILLLARMLLALVFCEEAFGKSCTLLLR